MDETVLEGLSPSSFQKDNVAEDAAADTAAQAVVLDMQEQLPGVQRLRDWALAALAPQPGETCVDVGSGTGAEVRRLAGLVGASGQAVGVEPHGGLRAIAEERSQGSGARYVDGAAGALPFADGSVDVIRCERVFQHLPDPEAAVREFVRVLRPGGRVVVIDSDWGSVVQTPGDPELVARLQAYRNGQTPNPFAGRLLPGQLRGAGLDVDPDIAATAVIPPDLAVQVLLAKGLADAVVDGVVTQGEADQLLAETRAAQEQGTAFLAVTMFGVLGRG